MRRCRRGGRSPSHGRPSTARRGRRHGRRRIARSPRAAWASPGSVRGGRSPDRHTSAGTRRCCPGRACAARPESRSVPPGTTFAAPFSARYTILRMRRWSELAERLAATTRTSEKTALVADYLRTLTPEELPVAAVFLTGRPFAEADQRGAGLGWSAIAPTVTEIGHVPRAALAEAYDRSSDLGIAVAEVLRTAGHAPSPETSPTLPEVAAAFAEIEAASGPARKSAVLRGLLERSEPMTAKYIVKVLGGDLRIGLREGLVEAGIARAFDQPLDDVKWAGMLVGDVGRLAGLARDATEIITRLGPEVWVEDKYDGIRAQLHKRGPEVRLYSRDLHDISSGYPEIVEAATGLPWDGILDGEILGWRDGTVLP